MQYALTQHSAPNDAAISRCVSRHECVRALLCSVAKRAQKLFGKMSCRVLAHWKNFTNVGPLIWMLHMASRHQYSCAPGATSPTTYTTGYDSASCAWSVRQACKQSNRRDENGQPQRAPHHMEQLHKKRPPRLVCSVEV